MEKREIETIVREVLAKLENTQGDIGEPCQNPFAQRDAELNFPGLVEANGGKTHVTMPLALAVRLIEKIEAKAAEWDMRVVTAVSDAAGRPVAVHCMDGAYIGALT